MANSKKKNSCKKKGKGDIPDVAYISRRQTEKRTGHKNDFYACPRVPDLQVKPLDQFA